MNLSFHGAAQTVTGSKHLLTLKNGFKILMDCGLFQGLGKTSDKWNERFGFKPSSVNVVILSHAHIDHCGLLPKLVADGFSGTIYATAPTMDLARILLMDSAKIQMQDAEYSNRQLINGELDEEPLYDEDDVVKTLSLFKIVDYNKPLSIHQDVELLLTDAGHIIGSAAVHLKISEDGTTTNLTFSADVGRYGDLLLKSPQNFPQAQHIILESTYGDRLHKEIEPVEDSLLDIIHHTCIIKKGKLIIPAFSVGRTQELLYALNSLELKNKLPDVQYYVDSPLSAKATEVLKNHTEVYNNGVKETLKIDHDIFNFKGLHFTESVEASKAINTYNRPCVIISASGMADSGRVRHHIRNNIGNTKNTILMVGYADPESLAGKLVNGAKEVYLFGEQHQVQADIRSLQSLSAHGDRDDLLQFLSKQDPSQVERIYLVHGEFQVQQIFAGILKDQGYKNVAIPKMHQSYQIDL